MNLPQGKKREYSPKIDITHKILRAAKKEARERLTESLFLIGPMLYWAEGKKSREEINFSNSDPQMIELAMKWFRTICKVPEVKFRIALNLISIHNKEKSENYWSKVTNIPTSQFHKTTIKPTPLKGLRKASYMGTCHIVVSDKNLFRKIEGWKKGILDAITSPRSSIG